VEDRWHREEVFTTYRPYLEECIPEPSRADAEALIPLLEEEGNSWQLTEFGWKLDRIYGSARAEEAFRKATTLEYSERAFAEYGLFLLNRPGREQEAESALKAALAKGLSDMDIYRALIDLVRRQPGRRKEVAKIRREAKEIRQQQDEEMALEIALEQHREQKEMEWIRYDQERERWFTDDY
jgi:hypothetical protein